MLASLSRVSRLALILCLGVGYVGLHEGVARADDEEDDDGGGGDEPGTDEPTDDPTEDEDPKDQPALTSGGLFTMKTYPVSEIQRPLTMTQGITQLRLGFGSDLSAKTAFEFFGVSLDAKYGYKDNFTLLGGFAIDYNAKGFTVGAGFEGALAYDVFDIRLQAKLYRAAAVSEFDLTTGVPTDFAAGAKPQFSVDLGFPFRYVAKPEIAIIALETLISIDFNAVQRNKSNGADKKGSCFGQDVDFMNCLEDGAKPDLAPSLGIATNPIPALSLVLQAQLVIRDFDTTNQFTIPATARIQYTPNPKFDIGAEFKFLNLKPIDPDGSGAIQAPSPIDQRFFSLYLQARY
jgi:hypothetical protein